MVGEPHPDVLRYMRLEHTASTDSRTAFITANFAMRTTSEIEFWFVNNPDGAPASFTLEQRQGKTVRIEGWPEESSSGAGGCRKPTSPSSFEAARRDCNNSLSTNGWPKLGEAEFIAARLYTGPM